MAALPQEAIVFKRSVTGQRKSIALSLGGTIADKIQQEQHRSVLDCESQESHDAQQELGNGAEAQACPIKSRHWSRRKLVQRERSSPCRPFK